MRSFGMIQSGILILAFAVFAMVGVAGEERGLNFLIILGDDISANSIGCYGSENPDTTPNIDQLASEGIKFTNMFVTEAICAPVRAELFTGLMPYRNGVSVNHASTKKGTLSVVPYLSDLGYRVGLTGKWHIKPASVYPFERVAGFPSNANVVKPGPEKWEGVEEFISRNGEEPFCMVLSSIHAHSPWDAGDSSRWELDEIKLPASLVDTPETRKYFREYLAEVRRFDDIVGQSRALLEKHDVAENTVLIVLDENGAGMPTGKWTTYDWGVRSACVMKWPKSYAAQFETAALAQYCDILPTLIEAAGGEVPRSMDGESLLPLITGKKKDHREKAYFLYNNGAVGPSFASRAVTDGRFKLIWTLTPETLFATRTVNGFDFGYVDQMEDRHVRKMYQSWLEEAKGDGRAERMVNRYRQRPEFQLFDLDSDPDELNNLAGQSSFESKVSHLKESIQQWMKQQGDPGS